MWTIAGGASVLNAAGGSVAFRFHARDVNLVMGGTAARDARDVRGADRRGGAGRRHGLDVDQEGRGTLAEQRMYQLVRQHGAIDDRTFEITFVAAGPEVYVFTFG